MTWKLNPFTGQPDYYETGSGSGTAVPALTPKWITTDPDIFTYDVVDGDQMLLTAASAGGDFSINLPLLTGSGRILGFQKRSPLNQLLIVPADGTIDGQSQIALTASYDTLVIADEKVTIPGHQNPDLNWSILSANLARFGRLVEMTWVVAAGTPCTTGQKGTTLYCPVDSGTIVKASAIAGTPPTGSGLIFQAKVSGHNIWSAGERLTLTAGSHTAFTETFDGMVLSVSQFIPVTLWVDQVGSSVAGQDITFTLYVAEDL